MIELFYLTLISFFFYYAFSIPKGYLFFANNISSFSKFEKILINIIIFLNISLIYSLFDAKLIYLIYAMILLLIYFFFKFKHKFNLNLKSTIFILLTFVLFTGLAANPILGWDGQAVWYPKVFIFYNDLGLNDLKKSYMSEYPHLGSYVWAMFWKLFNLSNELYGRLFFIFIFAASLFCLIERNQETQKQYIFLLIIFYLVYDISLFRGYQEPLIFSLINFFVLINFKYKKNFYLKLLICNALIWIKNESLVFVIPLVYIFIKNQNYNIKEKLNFTFLVFFLIFFRISLLIFFNDKFELQGQSFVTINTLDIILSRSFEDIITIFKHIIIVFFKYSIFLLLFLCWIINFKDNSTLKKIKIDIFIFTLASVFLIYFLTSADLEWHMSTSTDRILYSFSGFFIYYIFKKINSLI